MQMSSGPPPPPVDFSDLEEGSDYSFSTKGCGNVTITSKKNDGYTEGNVPQIVTQGSGRLIFTQNAEMDVPYGGSMARFITGMSATFKNDADSLTFIVKIEFPITGEDRRGLPIIDSSVIKKNKCFTLIRTGTIGGRRRSRSTRGRRSRSIRGRRFTRFQRKSFRG